MVKYNVVRTDKMAGTQLDTHLFSARYYANDTLTEIDNGMAVVIGDLEVGEREIFKATTPAANSPIAKVGLVASPEWIDDERLQNLTDFTNYAGEALRIYLLHTGDMFGVTEGCFKNAKPEVGQVVELAADTKWNNVKNATASSTVVGKIIAKETVGSIVYYVIKVD